MFNYGIKGQQVKNIKHKQQIVLLIIYFDVIH